MSGHNCFKFIHSGYGDALQSPAPLLCTDLPYKVLIGYIIFQNGRNLCSYANPNTPTKGYGQCACMVCLYRIRAQPFLHILDFFCALCYPIESFHPVSRTKVSPEWTHYSHSSPVRRGCIALHARTIAVFTHTIQFCCIIFDNSMLLRYFTHFLPVYAGHGLAQDKAKIC